MALSHLYLKLNSQFEAFLIKTWLKNHLWCMWKACKIPKVKHPHNLNNIPKLEEVKKKDLYELSPG